MTDRDRERRETIEDAARRKRQDEIDRRLDVLMPRIAALRPNLEEKEQVLRDAHSAYKKSQTPENTQKYAAAQKAVEEAKNDPHQAEREALELEASGLQKEKAKLDDELTRPFRPLGD